MHIYMCIYRCLRPKGHVWHTMHQMAQILLLARAVSLVSVRRVIRPGTSQTQVQASDQLRAQIVSGYTMCTLANCTNKSPVSHYIYLYLCALVWPSKSAKLSDFRTLAETNIFKPSMNSSVVVKIQDHASTENFPLTQCPSCTGKLEQSRLIESVSNIHWDLLNTSTYDLQNTVSCV